MRSVPATGSKTSAAHTPSAESPAIDRDLGEVGVEVGLALRVDLPRGDLAPVLLEDLGEGVGLGGPGRRDGLKCLWAPAAAACSTRRARDRIPYEPAEPLARDAGEAPAKRPAQAPRKTPLEAVDQVARAVAGEGKERQRRDIEGNPRQHRDQPADEAEHEEDAGPRETEHAHPERTMVLRLAQEFGRIQVRGHRALVRRHGFAAHDGRSHYARPRRPSPPVAPPPDPIDAGER